MSGNYLIAGISARPQPGSKTTAVIQNLIQSIGQASSSTFDLFELAALNASLRAASFRLELGGPAKYALDRIEQSQLLIVGISVKVPTGYPALLRYLFEMADPAALAGKPAILVKTHSSTSTAQAELDVDMLMRFLGLDVVSSLRLTSDELLQGVLPGDRQMKEVVAALYDYRINTDGLIADQLRQAHLN